MNDEIIKIIGLTVILPLGIILYYHMYKLIKLDADARGYKNSTLISLLLAGKLQTILAYSLLQEDQNTPTIDESTKKQMEKHKTWAKVFLVLLILSTLVFFYMAYKLDL